MIYSYGGGNIECTERKDQQKCALPKRKNLFITTHLRPCLPKEISHDDLPMSGNTTRRLQASHLEVFWRELDSLCELCGSRIPDNVDPLFYEELFNRYE